MLILVIRLSEVMMASNGRGRWVANSLIEEVHEGLTLIDGEAILELTNECTCHTSSRSFVEAPIQKMIPIIVSS